MQLTHHGDAFSTMPDFQNRSVPGMQRPYFFCGTPDSRFRKFGTPDSDSGPKLDSTPGPKSDADYRTSSAIY